MNREVIMSALFRLVTGPPMMVNFTADTATGGVTLGGVSDVSNLLVGMPINGPGIPEHTYLATITPTVTVTLPATADLTASPLVQGFQTYSRRLAPPSEEADMPSLYLLDIAEQHFPRTSSAPGWIVIECELWIFSDAGEDSNAIPATELNMLLDALQRAIDPPPTASRGRAQNLGLHGVLYCRIEGEVQKDPGHNGRIAGAIVPVKIRVGQDVDNYPASS
jgi:hypothetical protein